MQRPGLRPPVAKGGLSIDTSLLDALPVPVLIHDEDVIHYANQCACSFLRSKSRDELAGAQLRALVHRDGHEAGALRRTMVLEHGIALHHVPVKLNALDGSTLHTAVDAVQVDYDGRAMIMVVLNQGADAAPALRPGSSRAR